MKSGERIPRPTPTPLRQARLAEIAKNRTEAAAKARIKRVQHVLDDTEVRARLASVPVEGWDRTVLGTVVQLAGNAHDEAILKTLQRAGHPSLTAGALRRALHRLEEHGFITPQRGTRGTGGRARVLKFWVSTV